MSKCIVLIAATGQGKSSYVKRIINPHEDGAFWRGDPSKRPRPCIVYDVNGEYNLPTDTTQPRSQIYTDPQTFIKLCRDKVGGTWCVFEEATGFLVGAMQKQIREFIISKRHPVAQGGRNIIFLFHTIGSVPPFILDMADYIVLFKTGDDLATVKKKRQKLVPYFQDLQRKPDHSYVIIKNT